MECFFILFVGRIAVTHRSGDLFFSRTATLLDSVTFGFDVISDVVFHNLLSVDGLRVNIIEAIPCPEIMHERPNLCLVAYPIVCHIDVGRCIEHELLKSVECINETSVVENHAVSFVFHTVSMAYLGAFFKGVCATLPTGFAVTSKVFLTLAN